MADITLINFVDTTPGGPTPTPPGQITIVALTVIPVTGDRINFGYAVPFPKVYNREFDYTTGEMTVYCTR